MRPLRPVLVVALAAALACAGPAVAAPKVDGVFNLPGVQTNGHLTTGPDGNIWVVLAAAVARVTPDGTVTPFAAADLNNQLGTPQGAIASAGGFLWVSQTANAGQQAILRIDPAHPEQAAGVDVTNVAAGSSAMAVGPDGDIWVGQPNQVVKFAPGAGATITGTPFAIAGLAAKDIARSGDGTVWVADGTRMINITNLTTGTFKEYSIETGGMTQGVAGGLNGQIAYSNPGIPQSVDRLVPNGTPQPTVRPNGSDPFGVVFGNDRAFWFAEFAGNRLARLTSDGQLTTLTGFPAVAGQGPRQITLGPNDTLWTTLDNPGDPASAKIARITGVDPPPPPPVPPVLPIGPPPGFQFPPTPAGPDLIRPVIGAPKLTHSSIQAGTRSVRLTFTVSERSVGTVTVIRRATGRRQGERCVAPTRRLRTATCLRLVRVKSVGVQAAAGANMVTISTRTLPAGRYRLVLALHDAAGNAAVSVTRSLTVTHRARRH
jgi:virginiamycin B lyase